MTRRIIFTSGISALMWDIDIPAGQKKSILTKVKIEAPRNMDIDLGWR